MDGRGQQLGFDGCAGAAPSPPMRKPTPGPSLQRAVEKFLVADLVDAPDVLLRVRRTSRSACQP